MIRTWLSFVLILLLLLAAASFEASGGRATSGREPASRGLDSAGPGRGGEPRASAAAASAAESADAGSASAAESGAQSSPKCAQGDFVCEKERFAFEAIRELHGQLDDDKNGDIDTSESEEFLRNELKYKSVDKRRSDNFHHNDSHITVDDLWRSWVISEVHNWTVDQVVTWLSNDVDMPLLVETFRFHNVDGAALPRLAVNHLNFVASVLGIKSVVSRQKLSLKAMDVVLFGSPRRGHSLVKDALLVTALAVAIGGIWFARRQYSMSKENLSRWEADLQSLQSLQERLVHEKMEKEHLTANKLEMEAKIKVEIDQAKAEAEELRQRRLHTDTELSRLRVAEEELLKVREALGKAERELEMHRGGRTASAELQRWLQITYELEQRAYLQKKAAAEAQLALAKVECEKLTRKRNAFLGSLRMAHGHSFDELELQIAEARQSLEEVKLDLTELQHRWQVIEKVSGLQVETNPGLSVLLAATGHVDPRHESSARRPTSAGSSEIDYNDDFDDDDEDFVGVSFDSVSAPGSISPSSSDPSGLVTRSASADDAVDASGKRSSSAHDLLAASAVRRLPPSVPSRRTPAEQRADEGSAAGSSLGSSRLTVASAVSCPAPEDVSGRKLRPSLIVGLTQRLRNAKVAASKAVKDRELHTT